MAIDYRCDWCGQPIDGDDPMVTIDATGQEENPGRLGGCDMVHGWIGHYHATVERPCYHAARDALLFMRDSRRGLDAIDTATPQKVAALRRRHLHDNGERS